MLIFSTGLRAGQAVTGSLKSLLDGCSIRIYSGPVPASADAALSGNSVLVEVLQQTTGDGLTFEGTAPNAVLEKSLSEIWESDVALSGDATFFRIVKPADTGNASTTEIRIQGTCGLAGADMPMSSTSLVAGAPHRIEYCNIALPASIAG